MSTSTYWNQKWFIIVTGASSGFGRAAGIELSKEVAPGSLIVLIARSLPNLEETKSLIHQVSPSVHVHVFQHDLSHLNKEVYLTSIQKCLDEVSTKPNDFDQAIIIHNAASMGNITQDASQYDNVEELQDCCRTNLTSMVVLTSQFLKIFSEENKAKRTVVQVSSLAAKIPCKGISMYSMMKAARGMFIQTLALEVPSITTLTYAPGVMDTLFYHQTRTCHDAEMCKLLTGLYVEGKMIPTEKSARKLMKILEENKFTNGDHTDYYDGEGGDAAANDQFSSTFS